MNILLIGDRTSLGKAFKLEAARLGHNVEAVFQELLTNALEIDSFINAMMEQGSHFDWVVNCYGRNRLEQIGSDTHLSSSSLLLDNVASIYHIIDSLVRQGHTPCRVLNIASQTYRIAQTNTAFYCASKAALVMLTRVMARELAERGWVINALAPGKIEDTKMAEITDGQVRDLRGWSEEEANAYALRNIPMRRFTNTAEVCAAMFAILQHLPSYVNGTCIDMTGGA